MLVIIQSNRKKEVASKHNTTQQKDKEGAFVDAAWEANTLHTMKTYQVNAVGCRVFSGIEVLLKNQVNISILRPVLLHLLCAVEGNVCVNGVGGIQMELQQAGYLDNIFELYVGD